MQKNDYEIQKQPFKHENFSRKDAKTNMYDILKTSYTCLEFMQFLT